MKKKLNFYPLILMLGFFLSLSACEKMEIAEQEASSSEEIDFRGENASYQFKVASPFFNRPFDAAEASNGDIMEINGEGVLSVNPNSAEGSGNFVHKDADGNTLGSGTWTATGLLTFRDNGPSPVLPETFRSGKADINVHLVADGGAPEFDAVLRVYCLLPEVPAPASWPEGIKINILGGKNFAKSLGGPTVFIFQE